VRGYVHSARTRSFSSIKLLKLSVFSCLTSDAATTAAKKAAQTVEYFILLWLNVQLKLWVEERGVACPLHWVWGEVEESGELWAFIPSGGRGGSCLLVLTTLHFRSSARMQFSVARGPCPQLYL
jgi:hypothetical protein